MTAARTLRLAATLTLIALAAGRARAADKTPWDPQRATSPATVAELKALEAAVEGVAAKVTPATVAILPVNRDGTVTGAGSGVIVSDDGLILTVAHVIGKPGQALKIALPDGTLVDGKALGVNPRIDAGMARITGKVPKDAGWPGAADGKWPAAPLGKSGDLKVGQWVLALGHPGGPKKDRPPAVRLGRFEAVNKAKHALQTDCTIVGGDSGGPLYDLAGRVIGIHVRISDSLAENYHVPVEDFLDQWDKLKSGDVAGKPAEVDLGAEIGDDKPVVKKVIPDGPADKAGMKVDDVVIRFRGERVHITDDLLQILSACQPGQTVSAEVLRGDEVVKLKVVLGKRAAPKDDKRDDKKDDKPKPGDNKNEKP